MHRTRTISTILILAGLAACGEKQETRTSDPTPVATSPTKLARPDIWHVLTPRHGPRGITLAAARRDGQAGIVLVEMTKGERRKTRIAIGCQDGSIGTPGGPPPALQEWRAPIVALACNRPGIPVRTVRGTENGLERQIQAMMRRQDADMSSGSKGK